MDFCIVKKVLILMIAVATQGIIAGDWPQWRGPDRDGKSTETNLLQEWPEGGPALAWTAEGLGVGYASVSMSGNHIYTLGDHGDRQFLIALDRNNGALLWKTDIGKAWKDKFPGPRGTPTIDGDRVYAISTEGDLVCAKGADGTIVWQRSLTRDFGGFMSAGQGVDWKYAESPLVDGDKVVVTPGANKAALVALAKMTGKEIWRAAIPDLGERGADGAGYASIVISQGGGIRQYVQLLGRGVVGIEAASGRFLWGYNRVANDVANITTPIVDGDKVFVTTGYGTGSALLQLSASGDGVSAKEVYWLEASTMQNHHGGVILHDGVLYTGTGHNNGFPLCVAMDSGKVLWGPIRQDGKSAAVTFADGHLYMRYQNGTILLVEANPKEYKAKGSLTLPEVKQFSWAHPVVADGSLFLREQDKLYVYKISR